MQTCPTGLEKTHPQTSTIAGLHLAVQLLAGLHLAVQLLEHVAADAESLASIVRGPLDVVRITRGESARAGRVAGQIAGSGVALVSMPLSVTLATAADGSTPVDR